MTAFKKREAGPERECMFIQAADAARIEHLKIITVTQVEKARPQTNKGFQAECSIVEIAISIQIASQGQYIHTALPGTDREAGPVLERVVFGAERECLTITAKSTTGVIFPLQSKTQFEKSITALMNTSLQTNAFASFTHG